jgi:hypothetical protein
MQEYLKDRLWVHLRRAAMAVLASGAMATTTIHANPSSNLVLVPPADRGTTLASFDVTDPAHIKGQGCVQLSASGPFDFISPLGNKAELVRFRQGQDAPPARDYPLIDTLTAYELGRIFDVKQVRAEFTKGDTGATFMLRDSGPYVIRRPGVEFIHAW